MSAADAKHVAAERKPFDSIEDSLEYIGLLREAIEANKGNRRRAGVRGTSTTAVASSTTCAC
jgi:hypothetical protein